AGEKGRFSLEDAVCAGLLVDSLAEAGAALHTSDAALAARRLGEHYRSRLGRLLEDAAWARNLDRAGRRADIHACLALDTSDEVPVFEGGAIVPGPRPPVRQASAAGRSPR
ncbi:MAG TPA: 2-phosphosulfolactate phosphatase, partial [Candidatus Limnocylindrales bacterium]|nr:2-phosphosulfolactate phosphatase [Candidatus Limnocylindrales bacterium]